MIQYRTYCGILAVCLSISLVPRQVFPEYPVSHAADSEIVRRLKDAAASGSVAEFERGVKYRYVLQMAVRKWLEGCLTDIGDAVAGARIQKEAVALAEEGVRLGPQSIEAHFVAGICHLAAANFGDTIRHLSKIPESSPLYGEAIRHMASAYASMSAASSTEYTGGDSPSKVVDANPSLFLIEEGQHATTQNRHSWIDKAKTYAVKAKTLLEDAPETDLTLGRVLLIEPRVREGSYAVPAEALACFHRYLERVEINEWTWRRVQYVLMFIKDAPPKVREKVELCRGRSPTWVRKALRWVRRPEIMSHTAIAEVVRHYGDLALTAGLTPRSSLRAELDDVQIDCMGKLSAVVRVADAKAFEQTLSLPRWQASWSIDQFEPGAMEGKLQRVAVVLDVVRHGVRSSDEYLLKQLVDWSPERQQLAAHVIADAEKASGITLKQVDQKAVNAMFRPVKLLEMKVKARGKHHRQVAEFVKAVEASSAPVVCRDFRMERHPDGGFLLEVTVVFVYRREVGLLN